MPIALEITLVLVLIACAAGVLPLLFQLRRTARGLDAFLLSSMKDLGQIASDVHASRVRMDHLAGSLQSAVNDLSAFAGGVGEAGRAVKELHRRFISTAESASRHFGGVLGGITAVMALFNRSKTAHEPDPEHQP